MTPIIIIGPGRSGTSLLFDSLSQHSQIESNGCQEPLCGRYTAYKPYHSFVKDRLNIDPEQHELINPHQEPDLYKQFACWEYIDHILKHQNIVKILYPHLLLSDIKTYIHQRSSFIIHMCRRNITSTILSSEIQKDRHLNNDPSRKVELSIKEGKYVNRFFKILNDERFVDHLFDKKILKIYYENLLENWDYYMRTIQEKMEIEYEKLKPSHPITNRLTFRNAFPDFKVPEKIKVRFDRQFWEII